MDLLKKDLGKALSSKDMAIYLGVDVKTVIKYYQELGGIRLGRQYRFFEKEVLNAVQKRSKMDCPSEERNEEAEQGVFNKERCHSLGNEDETKTRRRLEREDCHNIFG